MYHWQNSITDDFDLGDSSSRCCSKAVKRLPSISELLTLNSQHNIVHKIRYWIIRKVFVKYNTILPSMAPAEMLITGHNHVLCQTYLNDSISYNCWSFEYFVLKQNKLKIYANFGTMVFDADIRVVFKYSLLWYLDNFLLAYLIYPRYFCKHTYRYQFLNTFEKYLSQH